MDSTLVVCAVVVVGAILAAVLWPKPKAPAPAPTGLRGRAEVSDEDVIDYMDRLDRQARAEDFRKRVRGRNLPAHAQALNAAFTYTPAGFSGPPPPAPN